MNTVPFALSFKTPRISNAEKVKEEPGGEKGAGPPLSPCNCFFNMIIHACMLMHVATS